MRGFGLIGHGFVLHPDFVVELSALLFAVVSSSLIHFYNGTRSKRIIDDQYYDV
jgi:hypothetical protein